MQPSTDIIILQIVNIELKMAKIKSCQLYLYSP